MLDGYERLTALAVINVKQELRWRLYGQGCAVKSYSEMSTEELKQILDNLTWEHPELRTL